MCLGVPGEILSTSGDDPLMRSARVGFDGVVREVSLAALPDAAVGDFVIVHSGFALSRLDRVEAGELLGLLRRLTDPDGPSGRTCGTR